MPMASASDGRESAFPGLPSREKIDSRTDSRIAEGPAGRSKANGRHWAYATLPRSDRLTVILYTLNVRPSQSPDLPPGRRPKGRGHSAAFAFTTGAAGKTTRSSVRQ